jgi:uncharacterized protein YxeA
MADEPAQREESRPRTRTAEVLREAGGAVKTIAMLTPEQSTRIISTVLTVAIAVCAGYLIYNNRVDSHDQLAMVIRSNESQAETTRQSSESKERELRQWYSQELEKERNHSQRSDELNRQFLTQERDKDRAVIVAITTEMTEWRRVFAAWKKTMEDARVIEH